MLLTVEQNCTDLVYLVYLTLMHVSAVQISHHVGHGDTKNNYYVTFL
jgi:hypothetical protein